MTEGVSHYGLVCVECGEKFTCIMYSGNEPSKLCSACDTPNENYKRAQRNRVGVIIGDDFVQTKHMTPEQKRQMIEFAKRLGILKNG